MVPITYLYCMLVIRHLHVVTSHVCLVVSEEVAAFGMSLQYGCY